MPNVLDRIDIISCTNSSGKHAKKPFIQNPMRVNIGNSHRIPFTRPNPKNKMSTINNVTAIIVAVIKNSPEKILVL